MIYPTKTFWYEVHVGVLLANMTWQSIFIQVADDEGKYEEDRVDFAESSAIHRVASRFEDNPAHIVALSVKKLEDPK